MQKLMVITTRGALEVIQLIQFLVSTNECLFEDLIYQKHQHSTKENLSRDFQQCHLVSRHIVTWSIQSMMHSSYSKVFRMSYFVACVPHSPFLLFQNPYRTNSPFSLGTAVEHSITTSYYCFEISQLAPLKYILIYVSAVFVYTVGNNK